MSNSQQSGARKFPGRLTAFNNQVRIEQSIERHHPNLTIMRLPTTSHLRSDFDQLVSTYRPTLVKTAWGIVRDREVAEDVVQEALTKAYNNLKLGRPYVLPKSRVVPQTSEDAQTKIKKSAEKNGDIANMEAWLQTIVRNVAFNYLNSRHRRMNNEKKLSQLLVDAVDTRRGFENPEAFVLRTEEDKELHNLVETLPPLYASAIRLRFFQDYDYQAIADELHCPLGTVKSGINRGLHMLGEVLRGQRVVKKGRMLKRRKAAASQRPESPRSLCSAE